MIVRDADFVEPPPVADTSAVVLVETLTVLTVKVAVVLPAPIVTEPGGIAACELLESDTANPPVGAGPFKVTVPVEFFPPVTVAGLSESDFTAGVWTISVEETWLPAKVAVIVAGV